MPDSFNSLSVPAVQITSNVTVPTRSGKNGTPASKSKSHVIAIIGSTIGGVVGLFLIGLLAFLWRRKGLHSAGRSGGYTNRLPEDIVTPFNPVAPLVYGISRMTEQPQPLMTGTYSSNASGASPVLGPSSSSPLRVIPVTIPAGLSDKELAQLRSATSQPSLSTPTSSPQSDIPPSTSLLGRANTYTDGSSTTTRSRVEDQRPWQSEVDSLRREMERLRAERFDAEAPPSYVSEVGQIR